MFVQLVSNENDLDILYRNTELQSGTAYIHSLESLSQVSKGRLYPEVFHGSLLLYLLRRNRSRHGNTFATIVFLSSRCVNLIKCG